jgi:hypothetical protein
MHASTRTNEHLFRRLLRAILPLLVWLLHFAFCYGLAAAQCTPAMMREGGPDRILLGLATVVALAICVWLTWRRRGVLRHPDSAGLLAWAGFLFAALSLVAVAWNSVPIMLVAGCA